MTTMDVRAQTAKGSSDSKKTLAWGPVARGGMYSSVLLAVAPVVALFVSWRVYRQA